jgi:putative phosphoribosyl transferase
MQPIKYYNYFTNRAQAGAILAQHALKYRYENTIILALSEGGVVVGAEMARHLHSLIAMLLTRDIYLPDGRTIVGILNEKGGFVHNNAFSTGEIEEFEQEYYHYIEQAKMNAIHDMHVVLGQGGEISLNYFRDRVVIVVTDGALSGTSFDMAYDFLKPIRLKKLVMATPVASVDAIDKMHVMADDLIVLSAKASPLDLNHYYDQNDIPTHDGTINLLNDIILQWHSVEQAEANARALGKLPPHALA